ncbi:Leishmanolysin metalloprotease M8, Zn-binding site [Phytophthora sojae]|uniref:Leishmanolysin metalloprotease M8, Zn-binding site n=1 Tax=Phytophthora sojae (strain P6497) TaxID=1094619 RepID=G5ACF5_PHYSP|nr:Leishmanolysin metalloprotease M8, Zn-binding site [Phytophthora sojae]EGZ07029.1 Leishmanolysin metalloprotease M8, Zn-binding site [Phytophthora sojae]|eukprot:XP_009537793.1 Leishmanolysin metalloprotease M8, Zn-binding site [Phytophthora sojae]
MKLVMMRCTVVKGLIALLLPLARACIHDRLDHRVVESLQHYADIHPLDVNATNFESATAEDVYQPIRITPYYDEDTLNLISAEKRAVIYKVIPDAIERFRNALSVVPVQGKLAAQHSCYYQWDATPPVCVNFVQDEACFEMPMPAEHFGATRYCSTCPNIKNGCLGGDCAYTAAGGMEDTDFLLYVRSITTDNCESRTLAYASTCQLDQFDRPTFGMANFCPEMISTADEDYDAQLATALHEITHALGFSAILFPYMRYPDGTPRTPRDANGMPPTYKSGTCPDGSEISYYVEPSADTVQYSTERGHSVAKMVTPNVAAFVQSHFGCESLSGAEIEQQDGTGCLGSHWEERIFESEYMTPVISYRNVFSALTLAYFEDSGWYRANLSTAERLHFGENRGCAFATEKCINPATGVSIASDHFCTSNTAESCSVDATSRSVCSISSGETIPSEYRYFPGAPTKGGDVYADYCPINTGYSYGDCSDVSNVELADTTGINILGESYGSNARCTASTLRSDDAIASGWKMPPSRPTGCYAMRCYDDGSSNDPSQSIIEVTIPRSNTNDVVQVNCSFKGEQVSAPGFTGWLTCPDPNVICDSLESYDFVDDSGTGSSGSSASATGSSGSSASSSATGSSTYSSGSSGHSSGTGSSGTGSSDTGSGTANLRTTNAAHALHSGATWIAHLLALTLLVWIFY